MKIRMTRKNYGDIKNYAWTEYLKLKTDLLKEES